MITGILILQQAPGCFDDLKCIKQYMTALLDHIVFIQHRGNNSVENQ